MIPNLPQNFSTISRQVPDVQTKQGCKDRLQQLYLLDSYYRETSTSRELEKIQIEYLLSKFN